MKPFEDYFVENDDATRILHAFSALSEMEETDEPKFIFAHLLVKPTSYLFYDYRHKPEIIAKLVKNISTAELKEFYIKQIIVINREVELLIDNLLTEYSTKPVIILQADHGPALTFSEPDKLQQENLTDSMLKERMRIFNAYYLPLNGNDILYDSITPVNTFRLILNFYFDSNYKLLKDQSYYSTKERPYKFIDVTKRVQSD